MSFSSGSANIGNIAENWIFDISHTGYTSGNIRIALKDYHDGTNFYHGVILNKPSIRESIDLKRSIAKTSNLTINIANFDYQGKKISELLFKDSEFTKYFINNNTTVKSVINNDSPVTIGNFRLIDFSTDGDTIDLVFGSHRPWAFISFPQNKHEESGLYEPVVYGNFTGGANANSTSDAYGVMGTVYPVPVLQINSKKIYTLMPRAYTASDNAYLHMHVEGFNAQFVPLRLHTAVYSITSPNNIVDSTTINNLDGSGLNILPARLTERISGQDYLSQFQGFITTALSERSRAGGNMYSNQENMFKWKPDNTLDESVFASFVIEDNGQEVNFIVQTPKKRFYSETITKFYAKVSVVNATQGHSHGGATYFGLQWSGFSHRLIFPEDDLINQADATSKRYYDSTPRGGTGSFSTGTTSMAFTLVPSNAIPGLAGVPIPDEILLRTTNFLNHDLTARINSLLLYYTAIIPVYTASNDLVTNDHEELNKIKHFYCGGNGLQHGITGLSGNDISYVHEAHLDLLNRFAGLDVATNPATNIEGWGNGSSDNKLDHARGANGSAWKIRYWQLEPVELKKELERLQYEGGFIFKYKKGDTSTPQYIFIKNSYSSTDYTLTKNDISSVNIKTDSYSDLITKMSIEYQKHPAKNSYLFKQDSSNNTSRSIYGINAKENIINVRLSAYVSPELPSTPSSNPNDDFYTYYDNIFGDIKLNITGTIVNPKFYDIDVGDTVDFSDMYPEKAFGKAFTNVVFMITSLSRTMGSLKFTAREIGAIT